MGNGCFSFLGESEGQDKTTTTRRVSAASNRVTPVQHGSKATLPKRRESDNQDIIQKIGFVSTDPPPSSRVNNHYDNLFSAKPVQVQVSSNRSATSSAKPTTSNVENSQIVKEKDEAIISQNSQINKEKEKNEPIDSQMTDIKSSVRSMPDGCEELPAKSSNVVDNNQNESNQPSSSTTRIIVTPQSVSGIEDGPDQEIYNKNPDSPDQKGAPTESDGVTAPERQLSQTSSKMRGNATNIVNNVIAEAMVMQAEANQFQTTDNVEVGESSTGNEITKEVEDITPDQDDLHSDQKTGSSNEPNVNEGSASETDKEINKNSNEICSTSTTAVTTKHSTFSTTSSSSLIKQILEDINAGNPPEVKSKDAPISDINGTNEDEVKKALAEACMEESGETSGIDQTKEAIKQTEKAMAGVSSERPEISSVEDSDNLVPRGSEKPLNIVEGDDIEGTLEDPQVVAIEDNSSSGCASVTSSVLDLQASQVVSTALDKIISSMQELADTMVLDDEVQMDVMEQEVVVAGKLDENENITDLSTELEEKL